VSRDEMTERRSTELTHFVNAELVVISSHRVVDVALRWGRVGHGDWKFSCTEAIRMI